MFLVHNSYKEIIYHHKIWCCFIFNLKPSYHMIIYQLCIRIMYQKWGHVALFFRKTTEHKQVILQYQTSKAKTHTHTYNHFKQERSTSLESSFALTINFFRAYFKIGTANHHTRFTLFILQEWKCFCPIFLGVKLYVWATKVKTTSFLLLFILLLLFEAWRIHDCEIIDRCSRDHRVVDRCSQDHRVVDRCSGFTSWDGNIVVGLCDLSTTHGLNCKIMKAWKKMHTWI